MAKFFKDVDKTIFFGATSTYLVLFVFILMEPKAAEKAISSALNYSLNNFGWIYLLSFSLIFIFLIFLACGKYGTLKLGRPEDKPAYSFASWVGMLYGAGLGVGLVFFGVNEPMNHFFMAPFAANETPEAAADAMRLAFFHWGFHPWAMYTATGLTMAYFQHRRGLPGRVSATFSPMLGNRGPDCLWAKLIDIFAVLAILCGVATSVGFAGTQFAAGLASQYGFDKSTGLVAMVVVVVAILSTLSAMKGVSKGIKVISDGNMIVVLGLIAFVLIAGPTMFQLNTLFETLGDYINNFLSMSFFLDAQGSVADKTESNWIGNWSVTYFAWWVAFAPFVGGFLANISKGRTIREFILAGVFIPAILCFIWFTCYGGTAIYLTMTGVISNGQEMATNANDSLFIFLREMPLSSVTIGVAMVLVMTLIITSVNSATYVVGVMSSSSTATEPSLANRAFWGIFMGVNALLFMWIGGLPILRSSSMLGAFPFLLILLVMIWNMMTALKQELFEEETAP